MSLSAMAFRWASFKPVGNQPGHMALTWTPKGTHLYFVVTEFDFTDEGDTGYL